VTVEIVSHSGGKKCKRKESSLRNIRVFVIVLGILHRWRKKKRTEKRDASYPRQGRRRAMLKPSLAIAQPSRSRAVLVSRSNLPKTPDVVNAFIGVVRRWTNPCRLQRSCCRIRLLLIYNLRPRLIFLALPAAAPVAALSAGPPSGLVTAPAKPTAALNRSAVLLSLVPAAWTFALPS
jgi:hypothetical protein